MNSLRFTVQKWLKGEPFLQSFSSTPDALQSTLTGKTIAIVGNARALSNQTYGTAIDQADIVIRMHAAPQPDAKSHGTKTSWLALAMPVAETLINARAPDHLLWMAKKRKRLRQRFVLRQGFYLHPVTDWERMKTTLQSPPTTGIMLIDLVANSKATKIDLYGFDFFASLSLSGRRRADQVPHDFAAEKQFVAQLIQNDTRFTLNR